MKIIATFVVALALIPMSQVGAADTNYAAISQQLNAIQLRIAQLQAEISARVLGVSADQIFTVTSDGKIIAQSYVPVSRQLATSWCADMAAMNSFKNTDIVCVHEGTTIFPN